MSKLYGITNAKLVFSFLTIILILCFTSASHAQSPDKVTTYQDDNGWKLQVNGEDFYVKGIVWGYTPIGENYSYNLWGHPDEYVQDVLDYECNLMKNAGINTIRSFGLIPPKWVAYIYEEHGIMTVVNHLMGRYGYNVGGAWKPQTDYSDELTRKTLIADIVEMVKEYKDTPGVIMFALGNESNYGLEWSSFEIEDLPTGEQHKEKAKFLYSLFNDVIRESKKVDSNHPYTIVNGDVQYLDLIKEHCTELDILGVNSYRGISFTDMWEDVDKNLDLPVMLTEFGSDGFNARENREEQEGQAVIIKGNWQEIYNKSYGKDEEGNAIGGCLFEWRDEWWKYLQTENLSTQDRTASWGNGGYAFDYVQGRNNMNEEWFGICRLSGPNADGVYQAEPRMAYDVLADIWDIDPYTESKDGMNEKFDNIDMDVLGLKGNVRALHDDKKKRDAFRLAGGRLEGDFVLTGLSSDIDEDGKDGLGFSNGEMLFLDFEFQPTGKLKGDLTLNILNNVADKHMEQYYGKRGDPITVLTSELNDDGFVITTETDIKDNERVEIYDFEATYISDYFELTSFYHVPRFHWGYKGDFYGLMLEATDMDGMDIWNSKAPFGFEFTGKKGRMLSNLTIVAGPEVYWGANPKAIVKYDFGGPHWNYTFIHAEYITRAGTSATATTATEKATRQTSLSLTTDIIPRSKLEVGYLVAGGEKIDEEFFYMDGDDIYRDEIEFSDTQGAKAKITIDAFGGTKVDMTVNYAGLVADGGNQLKEFDTQLPYSGLGNKIEYEGGILWPVGKFLLMPRGLYRKNLLDANPIIEASMDGSTLNPGLSPRNRDGDPFAVLGNREAISTEFFVTYDPTPASNFYAWDSDKREDASFAFSIGGTVTKYETATDAHLFFYKEGGTNASFGKGLPAEDVWLAKGKFVLNPNPNLKIIAKIGAGKQQSSGNPDGGTKEYVDVDGKIVYNKKHVISAYVKKDAWGPYDWYRQFNITYPYQYKLDYSMLIDNVLDDMISSRIGVKGLYRTLDEVAPEYDGGKNDHMFQISAYYEIEF